MTGGKEIGGSAEAIRRFAAEVVHRFEADRGLALAASLSFSTFLALVPIAAIGVAMLAAFPAFAGIRDDLLAFAFRVLVPEAGERIKAHFDELVRNAEQLTVVGLIALAAAATLLIATIESALNAIFRATSRRGIVARFLIYWAVLTLGPLLLGASFSLAEEVVALGRRNALDAVLEPLAWAIQGLPVVILVVAFALLYLVIPSRRVRFGEALWGGLVAAVLFWFLRWGFGFYVVHFPFYETLYGAISAVPILLVWTYLSWSAVLLGAVVAAVLTERREARAAGRKPDAA